MCFHHPLQITTTAFSRLHSRFIGYTKCQLLNLISRDNCRPRQINWKNSEKRKKWNGMIAALGLLPFNLTGWKPESSTTEAALNYICFQSQVCEFLPITGEFPPGLRRSEAGPHRSGAILTFKPNISLWPPGVTQKESWHSCLSITISLI